MKEQNLRDKFKTWLDTEPHKLFRDTQCVQIAKDYAEQEAIEFAEWIIYLDICQRGKNEFVYKGQIRILSELYQLFKNRENER